VLGSVAGVYARDIYFTAGSTEVIDMATEEKPPTCTDIHIQLLGFRYVLELVSF